MASPRGNSRVGIDRIIRPEWLERAANLRLAGMDPSQARASLRGELEAVLGPHRPGVCGTLQKTVSILSRVWLRPPGHLVALQERGLRLLAGVPSSLHLPFHWGMTMAVYPFWLSVAEHVGRSLNLRDVAVSSQVQRRMRERYGERETVARATRRILRSFVKWVVLRDTDRRGFYSRGRSVLVDDARLAAWLLECLLWARGSTSATLSGLLADPSLFPFSVEHFPVGQIVAHSEGLDVAGEGLEGGVIALRTVVRRL